jgi:hypothetical protein
VQEMIENIVEKSAISKKVVYASHLKKCIQEFHEVEGERVDPRFHKVIFKLNDFFKGFSPFIHEYGKEKKYEAGVEALQKICDELGLEVDENECFVLFHLRDLGKFRMKESKLHQELKALWKKTYKDYEIGDVEFSRVLRNLRDEKLIKYRRGNMSLCQNIILKYKV